MKIFSFLRNAAKVLMAVLVLLYTVSCIFRYDEDEPFKSTVLIYIAAENSLSQNANPNIVSMSKCIQGGVDNANLLVFVDRKDLKPMLLHLHEDVIDTLVRYDEMDSTNPEVLRNVIDYMRTNWAADYYGLVLWSHGTGWIPTSMLHFVAPNLNYSHSRDDDSPRANVLEIQRYPSSVTKAFAMEDSRYGNPPYVCMDLDELSDAIPDGLFNYIAFDACYMGNVEVAYALRHKARYIISSCYEIVSQGFPYQKVTRDFMEGNLLKVCREFFSYYDNMSGWERMGGISLVKTEGLDSLAHCFSKMVSGNMDYIQDMDVSKIQRFDRFRNHTFFDLGDFVDKLGASKEYKDEFRAQLERCVPYKVSTPYIFPGEYDSIKVEKYCGLSVYIPMRKYEADGLNDKYRETEWCLDTGYY